MKTIIVISILLCAIALPTYSEQPQNNVETDIAVIKTEIKNLKEAMEKGFANMQTQLDSEIKNLKGSMEKGFDSVNQKFDDVQKNFDRLYTILIYFITVPMATLTIVVAIWGILTTRRSRKEDTLQKQIETLTQKMETFTQEIETLKKQRIVS